MMKRILSVPALTVLALLSSVEALWAHQGHGFDGTVQNLIHWLSSPDHTVAVLVAGCLVGVAVFVGMVRHLRRRSS
jgi:hydrogenase/urease accessory protein HupE